MDFSGFRQTIRETLSVSQLEGGFPMSTIRTRGRSIAITLTLALVMLCSATASAARVYTITAYSSDARSCGKWADGYTATMHRLKTGDRVVAVDPKVIPLYAWVHIEGLGWYRALDVGGAIKGRRIDVWHERHRDAIQFGRQRLKVRWQMTPPPEHELARSR